MKKRDTYGYKLKDGNETTYIGITNDPERRAQEHENDGKKFTKMEVDKYPTSRKIAGQREKERIATYMRNHDGKLPRDNKNDSGK